MPALDLLWPKVAKGPGCWGWTAAKNKSGYGVFWVDGKSQLAHRVVYEVVIGPIPEGLQVDHLCENKGCVNPSHLEAVTQRENLVRATSTLAGQNVRKQECPQGHPYSEENTYTDPRGKRECRICRRENIRLWKARRCQR